MGMLRLAELEMEGIRSFVDRVRVRFPYPGAVLINGRTINGGVTSGTGKSTIPIAASHALDCCDLPATVLKSRYGGKHYVRLGLVDVETGDRYDIIRNPKLKVVVNGIEVEGLAKAHEEKFREILRSSPDLIKVLTYRQQREKGRFLNQPDSANKEFLSSVLGLGQLELASDSLSADSDRISKEIEGLRQQIMGSEQTLPSLMEAKAKVPEAERAYSEARQRVQLLSSGTEANELSNKVMQVSGEIQKIRTVGTSASVAKNDNDTIRSQIEAINREVEALNHQICPTCRREWDQGQVRIDQLVESRRILLNRARGNMTVIDSYGPMEAALPGLQQQLEELNRKIGTLQAPLADARNAMFSAQNYLVQLSNQSSMADRISSDIKAKQDRIAALEGDSDVARLAAEALSRNGFLSVIFDDVLKEIEVRSNEMIGEIPNVATFSIQICSTHETKKGTVQKAINTKIFKDGEEVPFKSLSGGQQCSLELFTDLAVSETVKKRSGSPVGWMFLDEAMDGLDVETKKVALDVIRRHVTGTVVVIDHSTEIKEGFDQVIQVEFDGRESRVQQ